MNEQRVHMPAMISNNSRITPALKWAGGKTQLLEHICSRLPERFNRYFEPFVGGGAVLFHIRPSHAIINDINEQLINLYKQLKTDHLAVIQGVRELDNRQCDKDFYIKMRTRYNEKIVSHNMDAECAALMLWINKHCFNGLYRVNSRGLFNVPYNNKIYGQSVNADNIAAIGTYLRSKNVIIQCMDFETLCEDVRSGDFVYFDSPYMPVSETADFSDYTKNGFSLNDHKRLAALFRELDKTGAKLMLSNNDVLAVYEFYSGYNIQKLNVKRLINSNASKRTGKEVLITNY